MEEIRKKFNFVFQKNIEDLKLKKMKKADSISNDIVIFADKNNVSYYASKDGKIYIYFDSVYYIIDNIEDI
ncbi:hypothetical protein X275_00100 [Marinitoga sp. 1197]|uniref:hypothetical protein n=1 Tax=Marinitoga sp. 1197 TaxID=1428449 RepID=UPI000641279B|nr:hypothetical protein [Marinitoga sp. 1197]KLO24462.1 hypothetical protein X275_00100 [Marinitoga sp. 1197]